MDELQSFLSETYFEFDCIADCIWKFNHQIDYLKTVECEKLDEYFPDNKALQTLRLKHEFFKLEDIFPRTLNYSFVVFVYIELETRLMTLCDLIHEELSMPIRVKELKGSGIKNYINYLTKFLKINKKDLEILPVIYNLATIRNCIVHANGFIDSSKDSNEINNLIKNEQYLPEHHRRTPKGDEKLITSEDYDNEQRLKIDMHYPFLCCVYARDIFSQLIMTINESIKSHNK
jgi:hypothetical protein